MAVNDTELTPMQQQYRALKEKNKDSILFFAWATFTRCSMRMPSWPPGSWI